MKKNYLLTGASGFLGRIITERLLQNGDTVTAVGKKSLTVMADITQPFTINRNIQADIVIHAAGKAHVVPRTKEEEQAFFEVNFKGTQNLCYALEKMENMPQAFIFISTVAVYGVDEGEGIDEQHPLNGSSPYAKSKVLAEAWLIEWAKRNNVVLGVLRLPLIAGPNPPGNLGAMIKGIKTGRYLSIGNAGARKSMVWGGDVAGIIPKLAETGGTFNITDGHHPNFHELEVVISSVLKKSKPLRVPLFIAKFLGYAGDMLGSRFPINSDKLKKVTSTLTFNDSKARRFLGWSPSPVLTKIRNVLAAPQNK